MKLSQNYDWLYVIEKLSAKLCHYYKYNSICTYDRLSY